MKLSVKTTRAQILEAVSNEVRDLYYAGREVIPSIHNTSEFASFCGRTSQFGLRVNLDLNDFSFAVEKSSSAYITWLPSKKIVLPVWYFSPDAIKALFPKDEIFDLESVSLALSNGSHIHESLHSKLTTPIKDKTTPLYSAYYSTDNDTMKMIASNAAQAFEDIWNEGAASEFLDRQSYKFVQLKNSILFDFDDIVNMINEHAKLKDGQAIVEARLSFFTSMKALSSLYSKDIMSAEFLNQLASESATLSKLVEIAIELREHAQELSVSRFRTTHHFLYNVSESQSLWQSRSNHETASELRAIFTKLMQTLVENVKLDEIKNIDTGENGQISEPLSEGEKEAIEKALASMTEEEFSTAKSSFEKSSEIEKEVNKPQRTKFNDFDVSGISVPRLVFFKSFEQYAANSRGSVSNDKANLLKISTNWSFISKLRQIVTENHTTGELFKSGPHLVQTKLSQLKTTGRVFSTKSSVTQTKNDIEIILNVDLSGSVGFEMAKRVLSESLAFQQVVLRAGYKCDVYCHTGLPTNSDVPALIKLSSGGVNGVVDAGLESKVEKGLNVLRNQNYDGYAIMAVAKFGFSKKSTAKKVIINLSDGEPWGGHYRNDPAIRHTKKSIAFVRKSGIQVFAMSFDASVIEANDNIYSKEFHIDASGEKLPMEFKKLILKLQGGGAKEASKTLRSA
jgi:hypothetical protein